MGMSEIFAQQPNGRPWESACSQKNIAIGNEAERFNF
jgi:hypothetical protein